LFDFDLFAFSRRINRPLILDGALGSLLQQKNLVRHPYLWMSYANITHPIIVSRVHKSYINAGADIITTNTFRTNPIAVKNSSLKIKNQTLVKKSVEIAKKSAYGYPVLVAGSNAPAEDCYQIERKISFKELQENHELHIQYLVESGVDFILNETQSHLDEIKIICKFCSRNKIPFIISLFFNMELKLLSGENISEIIKFIKDHNSLAISFNCIQPSNFKRLTKKINFDFNWGFYLNCLSGNYFDKNILSGISPADFSKLVKPTLKLKPSFIGSCCGSTPNHIRKIKEMLDENNNY
jgi:homocysteine S-methyltransferase